MSLAAVKIEPQAVLPLPVTTPTSTMASSKSTSLSTRSHALAFANPASIIDKAVHECVSDDALIHLTEYGHFVRIWLHFDERCVPSDMDAGLGGTGTFSLQN